MSTRPARTLERCGRRPRPADPARLRADAAAAADHRRRLTSKIGDAQVTTSQTLPQLPITDDGWAAACALAERCRRSGKTAPAIDVLVAACARHHGVGLDHDDQHFDVLLTL